LFEKGFVVLVLLISTNCLPVLLRGEWATAIDPVKGDPVMQNTWLAIYVITALLLAVRWRWFIHIVLKDKLLMLLITIPLISVVWSTLPDSTLRRGVALIGTSLFGIYLAGRFSSKEILRLLAWALGIAMLLSLLYILVLPDIGRDFFGKWRGIYVHKNILGWTTALSTIVFTLLLMSRRGNIFAWAGLILSVGLLLPADSATSLVLVLIVVPLIFLYKWGLRGQPTLVIPFLAFLTFLGGAVAVWFLKGETALDALGKDPTLTGRTEIWAGVLEMISHRPWLGWGYVAFWPPGLDGWAAYIIIRNKMWLVPHAHNGFLDIWLGLGLLGLAVFAAQALRALVRAAVWVHRTKAAEELWPLAFFSFILLHNTVETSILLRNDIMWILYVAASLSIFTRYRRDTTKPVYDAVPEPVPERARALQEPRPERRLPAPGRT
jgi:O-antigen ligase